MLNAVVRTGCLFDAVAELDAATLDPTTDGLRPEMLPDSTTGATRATGGVPVAPATWPGG